MKFNFETNSLNMVIENKLQSFWNIHEWIKTVGLFKTLINILIYDERKVFSLWKQDSFNLLINLDCLNFSYVYDILFQKTTFHSHLITLKKNHWKIDPDFLSNIMEINNSDDSANLDQSWNKTNDQFTGYCGFETQGRCNNTKLKFKLNYDYNITNMMNNKEINTSMSDIEIYNKVKLNMKVISFGCFTPENEKFDILSFVMNTLIIDNLNNEKVFQQLDNLDMLRFNIIWCFLL